VKYFVMWDTLDGGPKTAADAMGRVILYDTKELAEAFSERMKKYSSTGRFKIYPWPFKVAP
jgi:hypothetical protein